MTLLEELNKMEQLQEELMDRLKNIRQKLIDQAVKEGHSFEEITEKLARIER